MKKQKTLEWLVKNLGVWPKAQKLAPNIDGYRWCKSGTDLDWFLFDDANIGTLEDLTIYKSEWINCLTKKIAGDIAGRMLRGAVAKSKDAIVMHNLDGCINIPDASRLQDTPKVSTTNDQVKNPKYETDIDDIYGRMGGVFVSKAIKSCADEIKKLTVSISDDETLDYKPLGEVKTHHTEVKRNIPKETAADDQVKNPKHYQIIEGFESITVIASALTIEQWKGFCIGNILKYRIRAGKKGDLQQDIDKADFYEELYEQHKHLCKV